jgi:hypothetical protein
MKDFLSGPSAPEPVPSAEPPKLPSAPPGVAAASEALGAIPIEDEPELLEVIPVDAESAASGLLYDPAAQIEKLARLLEKGIITRREFEETKRKLLDQI